jgi:hypothetical protein
VNSCCSQSESTEGTNCKEATSHNGGTSIVATVFSTNHSEADM